MTSPHAAAVSVAPRLAVLGLGRVGLAYAAAIAAHERVTLAGLIESRHDLRGFARGIGFDAPVLPSFAKLRERAEVDAVVVCVPADRRQAQVEALVHADVPVLLEGLPESTGTALPPTSWPRLACATPLVLHPLFAHATGLLASGALGAPRRVSATANVSRVFSSHGAPHGLDVFAHTLPGLLVLLDAWFGPARAVRATGHRLYADRFDEAQGELETCEGLVAHLECSWSVPDYPQGAYVVEVECEHGRLLVSDDAFECELARACEGMPAGRTRRVLAEEPEPEAVVAVRQLAVVARPFAAGIQRGDGL